MTHYVELYTCNNCGNVDLEVDSLRGGRFASRFVRELGMTFEGTKTSRHECEHCFANDNVYRVRPVGVLGVDDGEHE